LRLLKPVLRSEGLGNALTDLVVVNGRCVGAVGSLQMPASHGVQVGVELGVDALHPVANVHQIGVVDHGGRFIRDLAAGVADRAQWAHLDTLAPGLADLAPRVALPAALGAVRDDALVGDRAVPRKAHAQLLGAVDAPAPLGARLAALVARAVALALVGHRALCGGWWLGGGCRCFGGADAVRALSRAALDFRLALLASPQALCGGEASQTATVIQRLPGSSSPVDDLRQHDQAVDDNGQDDLHLNVRCFWFRLVSLLSSCFYEIQGSTSLDS
jgi:hypothetical protein